MDLLPHQIALHVSYTNYTGVLASPRNLVFWVILNCYSFMKSGCVSSSEVRNSSGQPSMCLRLTERHEDLNSRFSLFYVFLVCNIHNVLSWWQPINKVETCCSFEHFPTLLCRLLLCNYVLKYFQDVPEKVINTNMSSQTRDLRFSWRTQRPWLFCVVWRLAGRQTDIFQITQRISQPSQTVTGHRRFKTKCWSCFFLEITSLQEQTITLTWHFRYKAHGVISQNNWHLSHIDVKTPKVLNCTNTHTPSVPGRFIAGPVLRFLFHITFLSPSYEISKRIFSPQLHYYYYYY
jgi:hypothetical protein